MIAAAVALAAVVQPANALYFYVTDGQQRCFIEEVPAETLIVGTYKNPDFVPFGRPDFTGVVSFVPNKVARLLASQLPADAVKLDVDAQRPSAARSYPFAGPIAADLLLRRGTGSERDSLTPLIPRRVHSGIVRTAPTCVR